MIGETTDHFVKSSHAPEWTADCYDATQEHAQLLEAGTRITAPQFAGEVATAYVVKKKCGQPTSAAA